MSYRIRYAVPAPQRHPGLALRWCICAGIAAMAVLGAVCRSTSPAAGLLTAGRLQPHEEALKHMAQSFSNGVDLYEAALVYCRELLAIH